VEQHPGFRAALRASCDEMLLNLAANLGDQMSARNAPAPATNMGRT
jgi:hypothetical protein